MRAVGAMLLGVAVGGIAVAAEFFARGPVDAAGWVWLEEAAGQAQWRFYDLPGEGHYLSVELLLSTRGWRTPPPSSLGITLKFFTFCSSLSRRMELQRVEEHGERATYFGQLMLARRDLDLGGYLGASVGPGPAGANWAVHPASLRVHGEFTSYAALAGGRGGARVFLPTPSSPADPSRTPSPPAGQTFRECAEKEEAPFLSPGRYWGELGWPGPGKDVDAQDWVRLNLNVGHILEIQVFSAYPVSLWLLDPMGREVGRVNGSGQIGIVCQASARGTYWACVSIPQSMPRFTYTLDVRIRR